MAKLSDKQKYDKWRAAIQCTTCQHSQAHYGSFPEPDYIAGPYRYSEIVFGFWCSNNKVKDMPTRNKLCEHYKEGSKNKQRINNKVYKDYVYYTLDEDGYSIDDWAYDGFLSDDDTPGHR